MRYSRFILLGIALLALSAQPLRAAGATLVVVLPENAKPQAAKALAPLLKLETPGNVAGSRITFANLLPETRYDLQITLADGTILQGVDLGWYSDEPAKPDTPPLDDDDRQQLKELFEGVKAFENKRQLLLLAGNHDRVTILAELIRDTPFHSAKSGEIIWRIELWYFKNQHGGWERVAQSNKVLRRERFASAQEFQRQTSRLRWLPALGGLRLAKTDPPKTLTLTRPMLENTPAQP